jgi:hypothetical protein
MKETLTAERLRELLHYDPDTGDFTWRTARKRIPAGAIAGTVERGFRRITIGGGRHGPRYSAHRLAWLYMTGAWPNGYLDHINRDPDDNRFANLRLATNSQNQANTRGLGY